MISAQTRQQAPITALHTKLSHADKVLDLSRPQVMGILNVTPDSFSDGGRYTQLDSALAHARAMIDAGASIIDIGAESTRPHASHVSSDEELARLSPIVKAVRSTHPDVWISIDTSSPKVMTAMAALGADMINDVRGLSRAGAAEAVAALNLPVVIMHSRGEPDTMNQLANYTDVIAEVSRELGARIDHARLHGVCPNNIIIDIGMGFAKNYAHHVCLMRELGSFLKLGYPMLFGVSRKRFLGEVLSHTALPHWQAHKPNDRDGVGAAAALMAVQAGARIIRTHNVAEVKAALALYEQLYLSSGD